ncbi:YPDG domain-containing protein, partial [Streptococcus thoraltensis]
KATTATPTFTDKDGKPVEAKDVPLAADKPFQLDPNNTPDGVTIDPQTGEVTFTPTDGQASSTVKVPVTVTYADGTTDTVESVFTVGEKPATNADSFQPQYPNGGTIPGQKIDLNPFFTKDGELVNGSDVPLAKDKPFQIIGNVPGATIDPNTGRITFTPTDDQVGKVVNIPVKVTYADGTTDTVDVPVTVKEPVAPVNPDDNSLSESASQSNDKSMSISASESLSATESTSIRKSTDLSESISASLSDSMSTSNSIVSDSMSASASDSVSKATSTSVSDSISTSDSFSTSLSTVVSESQLDDSSSESVSSSLSQ